MSASSGPEAFRRELARAAEVLAEFHRLAGTTPAPEARSAEPPADPALRDALAEAVERLKALEGELASARGAANAASLESRRLAAEVAGLRAAAAEAEARAVPLRERSTLLAAECVRLESMLRKAEAEASEAESGSRAAVENLRRELRAAKAAAERETADAAAREARAKSEAAVLSKRLLAAVSRLQAVERERKLESARSVGDSAALQLELERAQAVATALRAEVAAARRVTEDREEALTRELERAAVLACALSDAAAFELSRDASAAVTGPVEALLVRCLEAWEPAFRRGGVTLARDWTPPLPEAPHDAPVLLRVFDLALGGALAASPDRGRATVRAMAGPDGGLNLEFAVAGEGFPAPWRERLLPLLRRELRRWGGDAEASAPTGLGARLLLTFAPPPSAG